MSRAPSASRWPQAWELALSAAMALLLGLSFIWYPEALPRLPLCHFKHLTGLPCPGCGLTRAFSAISHGQLRLALSYNPFSFPLYGLSVFFLVYPWLNRRWPRLRSTLLAWQLHRWLPLALLAALTLWGLLRMLLWTPLG